MHTAFCGSVPLSFTTLFHTFQICLNITSTQHLSLFTFFTYWISSACVSFSCKNLDTNFRLFHFHSSYLILAISFLISLMYALPWTIFTFSFKSSNIPHRAQLIICTCCSSPWLVWTSLRNCFHVLHFHTKFQTFFILLDWSIVLAVPLLGQPVRPALNPHGQLFLEPGAQERLSHIPLRNRSNQNSYIP